MTRRSALLLVALGALLLYAPAVRNGFAYDDNVIIRFDERIHELSAAWRVFVQPYWPEATIGLYRPLASLSYALDWALSGGSAAWFHVGNAVWNAAASALVLLFLAAFVPLPLATLGALLFAAHPVHTEAVANIVGRAELMAACFSLAAMLVWVRSTAPRPASHVAAVTALFALALLSKESALMLPALLGLVDVARGALRARELTDWLRGHVREVAALGVTALLFLLARSAVLGGVGPGILDPVLDVADGSYPRVLTALQAWPIILRLLLLPTVLLADYGPGILLPAHAPTPQVVLGALVLAGLLAGGLLAWLRDHGRTAFVLLFVPVALLPLSNLLLPVGVIVAERALYLPSLAVIAGFAFAARHAWHDTRARGTLVAAALALVALGSVRTVVRTADWRSTDTVMAALARDRADSYRAQWYFAQRAVNLEQRDVALQHYARALSIWPYREPLTLEAAAFAARAGDHGLAARIVDFALTRWPAHVDFLRLQAALQLDRGELDDARVTLDRALALAPHDSTLLAMQRATAGPENR